MTQQNDNIKDMFEAGVHYGTLRASRNPSVKKYIYGTKSNVDIIDVEKTVEQLDKAKTFLAELKANNKKVIGFATTTGEYNFSGMSIYCRSYSLPCLINRLPSLPTIFVATRRITKLTVQPRQHGGEHSRIKWRCSVMVEIDGGEHRRSPNRASGRRHQEDRHRLRFARCEPQSAHQGLQWS